MNEFLKYIHLIKYIIDCDYEKERVFYNEGVWYDRNVSRSISVEEVEEIITSIVNGHITASEENWQLKDKLYELMGEEETEKFLESVNV